MIDETVISTTNTSKRFSTNLAFLGDVALHAPVASAYLEHGKGMFDPALLDTLHNSDIVVANLECALPGGVPRRKILLSTTSAALALLKDLGVTAVCLANNHSMDFSIEGLRATCEWLRAHGISWFGAGVNLNEAMKPLTILHKETTIAFFGIALEHTDAQYATQESGGVCPFMPEHIKKSFASHRAQHHVIVTYMHWGIQRTQWISREQVDVANHLIDAGANVIIGTHSHTIQPYVRWRSTPVWFGLGNFLIGPIQPDEYNQLTSPKIPGTQEKRCSIAVCHVTDNGITTQTVYSQYDGLAQKTKPHIPLPVGARLSAVLCRSRIYSLLWLLHRITAGFFVPAITYCRHVIFGEKRAVSMVTIKEFVRGFLRDTRT